jgi:hypothetical protein
LFKQILLTPIILFAACSPALTAEQIARAMPQVAAARTLTAEAQPGATHTAGHSPTPTTTPLAPAELTATAEFRLTGPHGDGAYQVGVSIAPGTWRSIPQRDGYCYWARRKYDGILLGEYYGPPGGKIFVRETDFEIEFDGCGVFVYMGE